MKKGKESRKGKQLQKGVSESRIVVIARHVLSLLSHKIEAYVSKETTKYLSIAASHVPRRLVFIGLKLYFASIQLHTCLGCNEVRSCLASWGPGLAGGQQEAVILPMALTLHPHIILTLQCHITQSLTLHCHMKQALTLNCHITQTLHCHITLYPTLSY